MSDLPNVYFKALDTFGRFVKDQYSFLVYPNIHKITNLGKFGPRWSSKLEENNGRKKHPYKTALISAFRCLILGVSEKLGLPLPQKLSYFRALHCSLPSKGVCANNYFDNLPIVSSAFKKTST